MLKPFTERLDPSVGDTVIANRKSFATFKTKIISAIDELYSVIFKAPPYTSSQHNKSVAGFMRRHKKHSRRHKKKRGKKTRNNRN